MDTHSNGEGSNQSEAAQILTILRDQAFDSSDEKLALALGRPAEEVEAWRTGLAPIDEDALMKARGIAMQRGVEIEQQ
jgi:hypothetical protein